MNKKIKLTEKLAYKILMFFTRHLGFQSFQKYQLKTGRWCIDFYNSSKHVGILRVFDNEVAGIRFDYKPTCKEVVNELLMFASNGEKITSLTSSYDTMTLMQPFTTLEELLVKMDLELSYE